MKDALNNPLQTSDRQWVLCKALPERDVNGSRAQLLSEVIGDRKFKERFLSKILVRPDGCWQWTASKTRGYGQFQVFLNGKKHVVRAYQISYQMCYGPAPKGLVIDHLCENRSCVNPAHLEAVSNKTNVRRYWECHKELAPNHQSKIPPGKNYPLGLRSKCARGKHHDCYASRCTCECHFPNRRSK